MRLDTEYQRRQELSDARAKAVYEALGSTLVLGEVTLVDDAKRTAAIRLEGQAAASSGIAWGEHRPLAGDIVWVEVPPLNGQRRIAQIVSRDAAFMATGQLFTAAITASTVTGNKVRSTHRIESDLTRPPGLLVYRLDGSRTRNVPGVFVNLSGQVTGQIDCWTEVVDTNRTLVVVEALALTTGGLPEMQFEFYVFSLDDRNV